MKITIREYRGTDRAHLIRCLDSMQDHMVALDPWRTLRRTPEHGTRFLQHLLRQAQRYEGFALIAEAGGVPAGTAIAWVRHFPVVERTAEHPTRMGYLSDLAVLPEWRGKGIGTRLIRTVEARFRRAGCDQFSLGVFAPNVDARRLYEREGFAVRGMLLVKRIGRPPKDWTTPRRLTGAKP